MSQEREIEAFIAVADQLSFTRAAEALGLSQSAVSQAVAKLEARLGVTLLVRERGRIRLSDAGRALQPEARRFIAAGDALREVAHGFRHLDEASVRRPLRIGASTTVLFGLLPDVIDEISDAMPLVYQMSQLEQDQAFERGDLDIGIRRSWQLEERPGHRQLFTEHLYIACRRGHPGAVAGGRLTDFVDEPLLMFRRAAAPAAHEAIMGTLRRAGLSIPSVRTYRDEADFIGLVACGAGFGIVPFGMTRVRLPQIVYIRIEDDLAVTPVSLRYSAEVPEVRHAAGQLATALRAVVHSGQPRSLNESGAQRG